MKLVFLNNNHIKQLQAFYN